MLATLVIVGSLVLDAANRLLQLAVSAAQLAALHARRLRPVHRTKAVAQRAHAAAHARAKTRYARRHPTAIGAHVAEHMSLVNHIALMITQAVGSLWCAVLFTSLSLVSLPAALATHDPIVIVAWIAQTFLQLVLLSIILKGQSLEGHLADLRADARDAQQHAIMQEMLRQLEALRAHDVSHDRQIAGLNADVDALQEEASPATAPAHARKSRRPRPAAIPAASATPATAQES